MFKAKDEQNFRPNCIKRDTENHNIKCQFTYGHLVCDIV
jgi:hypothetical protein